MAGTSSRIDLGVFRWKKLVAWNFHPTPTTLRHTPWFDDSAEKAAEWSTSPRQYLSRFDGHAGFVCSPRPGEDPPGSSIFADLLRWYPGADTNGYVAHLLPDRVHHSGWEKHRCRHFTEARAREG